MKTAFLLVSVFYFLSFINLLSATKEDSLRQVIAQTGSKTVRSETLFRLGEELARAGKTDSALQCAFTGLKTAEHLQDKKLLSSGYKSLGYICYISDRPDSALVFYEKVLNILPPEENYEHVYGAYQNIIKLYEVLGKTENALQTARINLAFQKKLKKYDRAAMSHNRIGMILTTLGNYPEALKEILIGEQLSDRYCTPVDRAKAAINKAVLYQKMKKYDLAIEGYLKSAKNFELSGDRFGQCLAKMNVGTAYIDKSDYVSAEKWLSEALRDCQLYEVVNLQGNILLNLGACSEDTRRYPEALQLYLEALEIFRKQNDVTDLTTTEINISGVYINLKQYATARNYALKAFETSKEMQIQEYIRDAAKCLYQCDSATKNYEGAFKYLHIYKKYSDSLTNVERSEEIGRIESQFAFEKKAEIEKARLAAEAQAEERRNSLQYIFIFVGLIVLFSLPVFIGRLKVPFRITEILLFTALLLTFEFLLILTDPLFDRYSGGIPLYKLGFNTLIAFGYAPLHSFLEKVLRQKLLINRRVT